MHLENFLHSPPIQVKIQGNCVDLPIYVEKELYDLDICLMNQMYREKLVFHNRGGKPMKIQMILPPEVTKFISLNPSFGYIEPYKEYNIWLKLELTPQFLTMCKKFEVEEGDFLIPLKLIGSERKKYFLRF